MLKSHGYVAHGESVPMHKKGLGSISTLSKWPAYKLAGGARCKRTDLIEEANDVIQQGSKLETA